MKVLQHADAVRIKANTTLDPDKRGSLGQFFTNAPICLFMSSLFSQISGDVKLLDPGCGPGSLSAAFTDETLRRGSAKSLSISAFDVEERLTTFIEDTLTACASEASAAGLSFKSEFTLNDYILSSVHHHGLLGAATRFTHCIMNPPYKKISSSSEHRRALRASGVETVNLYAGFVALALKQLEHEGELVAIIPRSFCNGPYYLPFREILLKESAIKHIHIFDSRNNAFYDDKVLQENVIIHLVKGAKQQDVTITSSPAADFYIEEESNTVTVDDMTIRSVAFERIVNPLDKQKFIHIAANERDQAVIDKLNTFNNTLDSLDIQVSTGPVVDFRLKDDLRKDLVDGSVPLIYPVHLNGGLHWPKVSKKPNAIAVSEKSKSWLWKHGGYFLIVRRFSSKEEKRRIVATIYDSSLPGKLIGFENKLNVFHKDKSGFDKELAQGLYVYLNSTLLDKYYRLFGGHTQVNATDLRNINYPSAESLRRMGKRLERSELSQQHIDHTLDAEIFVMTGDDSNIPLKAQEKINQAIEILTLLGMPRAQQNERSALTLLALLNLRPEGLWEELEKPLIGVTPIMDWARDVYGKEYAPNTRETFRRQTLHQFVDGGLVLYNPDKPDRPVNSPKACYQIAPDVFNVLMTYDRPC